MKIKEINFIVDKILSIPLEDYVDNRICKINENYLEWNYLFGSLHIIICDARKKYKIIKNYSVTSEQDVLLIERANEIENYFDNKLLNIFGYENSAN